MRRRPRPKRKHGTRTSADAPAAGAGDTLLFHRVPVIPPPRSFWRPTKRRQAPDPAVIQLRIYWAIDFTAKQQGAYFA